MDQVCDLAAWAVKHKNPDYNSVRPFIEIAFNQHIQELQWVHDNLPLNDPRFEKSHFEGIINVLKSCRSPFQDRPNNINDAISLLERVSKDYAFRWHFYTRNNRFELVTLGDAEDVKSCIERLLYDPDTYFDTDTYHANMERMCRHTIELAQTHFFRGYVTNREMTILNRIHQRYPVGEAL